MRNFLDILFEGCPNVMTFCWRCCFSAQNYSFNFTSIRSCSLRASFWLGSTCYIYLETNGQLWEEKYLRKRVLPLSSTCTFIAFRCSSQGQSGRQKRSSFKGCNELAATLTVCAFGHNADGNYADSHYELCLGICVRLLTRWQRCLSINMLYWFFCFALFRHLSFVLRCFSIFAGSPRRCNASRKVLCFAQTFTRIIGCGGGQGKLRGNEVSEVKTEMKTCDRLYDFQCNIIKKVLKSIYMLATLEMLRIRSVFCWEQK